MNRITFKRYQPAMFRLWHWLNALAIFGLLGTVLLRKSFLSWRTNSALIETKIKEAGGMIETGLATSIAKSMRDIMWEWHIYFGLALAALLVLRVALGIVLRRLPAQEALNAFKSLAQAQSNEKKSALHYLGVKLSHVAFYVSVLFMAVSGLLLTYGASLGLSKARIGSIKESHELAMWLIVAFVVAHLLGVILAELTKYQGIVSDMIHGGEKEKRD